MFHALHVEDMIFAADASQPWLQEWSLQVSSPSPSVGLPHEQIRARNPNL
jgi:hypothetical protein|tara:strand:- start:371 stop:520 length:150 start_codon:yes stop_codon:yes gene_type:complete